MEHSFKKFFDSLEKPPKKKFKVSCYKYGYSEETMADDKKQAISNVAVRYAKSQKLKPSTYGRIIKDFKNSATVKLLESCEDCLELFEYIKEGLNFERDPETNKIIGFDIKSSDPKGYGFVDLVTLRIAYKLVKELIRNKKDVVSLLKQYSHRFSPLMVAISMMVMGINTQKFIDQHPEVLNVGNETGKKIVDKAAEFLNKNPRVLEILQRIR